MLPLEIKDRITKITNLFNNYEYMQKDKEELEQIKISIIEIIKKLANFTNLPMAEFVHRLKTHIDHQKDRGPSENSLIVNDAINTSEFYQYCYTTHNNFVKFLNKLKSRLATLETEQPEFTDIEKDEFYNKIGDYIEQNEVELLEELLNKNLIDVNYVPPIQNGIVSIPLIIVACDKNNLAIAKMLHNNNANLNVNIDVDYEDDASPLLAAIMNKSDNNELIIYLLDNGANPNFIGGLGTTPLNEAIDDLILYEKMIREYGANVNLEYPGGTILIYACEMLKFEAIKILLANGANVNLRCGAGYTALHYLFGEFNNENQIADIKTIIDLFITNNFNFNFQNEVGDTVLHILAITPLGANIIKYLLDKNINYDVNLVNINQDTPLHKLLSVYEENDVMNVIEIITWFIRNGFNINVKNNEGNTILHKSFKKSLNFEITKYLLDKNIRINTKNELGDTALHHLVNYFENEKWPIITQIIKLFVKYNFNFNIQNNSGDTALHYLISTFNSENWNFSKQIIEIFAICNFNFNLQNNWGDTVLHRAITLEVNIEVIEALLNNSASPDIINCENQSVWDLLKECENPEFLRTISRILVLDLSTNSQSSNSVRAQKRKYDGDDNE